MFTLAASTHAVAPLWLVLPVTGILMAIITAHVMRVRAASVQDLPERRRRIRLANGALMYVMVPLLAYAMAVVTPSQPKAFVWSWTLVAALSGMILTLGIAEAMLIRREHRTRLSVLRRQFSADRERSDA